MSLHPYMGWGVFVLQATKANDELFSYTCKAIDFENGVKKYVQNKPTSGNKNKTKKQKQRCIWSDGKDSMRKN